MRLSDAERRGLARARAHYRRAVEELPAGRYTHMRSILESFVRSIDDEIGTDPADAPADGFTGPCRGYHAGDCRCGDDALADDAEMPYHRAKSDGDLTDREMAHVHEMPRHQRGEC